jgi:hypothetical protein
MNSNHKHGADKNEVIKNPVDKANAANANATAKPNVANKKQDIKNEANTGENCEPNPLKGMSYIPPKDENTL